MKKTQLLFALYLFFIGSAVMADNDIERLKQAIAKRLPNIEVTSIKKSPVDGLFEVVSGSQVVYMTQDAKFMIDGDLVNLESKRNYTEEAKAEMRLAIINSLGEDQMLIYKPETVKHTVTIITDINCPYCRRLHDEMSEYLKYGVRVRYIFMPLKGKADFDKTVSVWCSDDRHLSLDIVKAGGSIESKTCKNPIKKHLTLSRKIGVRGTPAIILEDGTMLPGYVPINKLMVEIRKI